MYKIGTSGYSFKDWVETVYPKILKSTEYLSFYEKELGFNTVEINYTYYRLPSAKSLNVMSQRTSKQFEFMVKAYKDMTHSLDRRKEHIEPKKEVFSGFIEALQPLRESEKLGGVLAQFPFSFHANRINAKYLIDFKELMEDIPLFIEFRNSEWIQDKTFDFLQRKGLGYCSVDEPPLKGLVPFREETTSDLSYVRLHGRNLKWFEADVSERYNYNYSKQELSDLSLKIKKIHSKTKKTYVFFNNCHQGFAVKNTKEMVKILQK